MPITDFTAELRKWGIQHLVVWSRASLTYLRANPTLFAERWHSGAWHQFEYLAADTRDVWTSAGPGRLVSFDALGASLQLDAVTIGTDVVVRTNYHPSWTAHISHEAQPIALHASNGQLAFTAPRAGTYLVALVYPRRSGLLFLSIAVTLMGAATLSRWPSPRAHERPTIRTA